MKIELPTSEIRDYVLNEVAKLEKIITKREVRKIVEDMHLNNETRIWEELEKNRKSIEELREIVKTFNKWI